MNVPKFCKGDDVELFLEDLQDYLVARRVPISHAHTYLPYALKGEVLLWYRLLVKEVEPPKGQTKYEAAVEALMEAYGRRKKFEKKIEPPLKMKNTGAPRRVATKRKRSVQEHEESKKMRLEIEVETASREEAARPGTKENVSEEMNAAAMDAATEINTTDEMHATNEMKATEEMKAAVEINDPAEIIEKELPNVKNKASIQVPPTAEKWKKVEKGPTPSAAKEKESPPSLWTLHSRLQQTKADERGRTERRITTSQQCRPPRKRLKAQDDRLRKLEHPLMAD